MIKKGTEVLVYDKFRFAIPLRAIVEEFNAEHDSVRVKLLESNNTNYPVGCTIWVHGRQLWKVSEPAFEIIEEGKYLTRDGQVVVVEGNRSPGVFSIRGFFGGDRRNRAVWTPAGSWNDSCENPLDLVAKAPKPEPAFKITGPGEYITRVGQPATVTSLDDKREFTAVGTVGRVNADIIDSSWRRDGTWAYKGEFPLDIVSKAPAFTIDECGKYRTRSREIAIITTIASMGEAPVFGYVDQRRGGQTQRPYITRLHRSWTLDGCDASNLHKLNHIDKDSKRRKFDLVEKISEPKSEPGMVEILEKILNDIQYGRIGRNDGIVYDSVTWRQITNALAAAYAERKPKPAFDCGWHLALLCRCDCRCVCHCDCC